MLQIKRIQRFGAGREFPVRGEVKQREVQFAAEL